MDEKKNDKVVGKDDEVVELYHQKNYVLGKAFGERFAPLELEDFFRVVFGRDNRGSVEDCMLPFEAELCHEYMVWRNQKDRGVKKIDYRGCAKRLYNGLVLYRGLLKLEGEEKKKKGEHLSEGDYRHHTGLILLDDDGELKMDRADKFMSSDWALTYPVTFIGKRPLAKYARYLYGFVIDLDGVGLKQLDCFLDYAFNTTMDEMSAMGVIGHYGEAYYPQPNIIVNSGHGLHLYYLLDAPVAMFTDNCAILSRIKRALIERIWNTFTSTIEQPQYQGIYQGYRVPGTKTKFGEVVTAWYVRNRDYYTLEELNLNLSWKSDKGKMLMTADEISQLNGKGQYTPNRVTLEEAKRRWPDWYQRVVVKGEKGGQWKVSRRVYEWFLRQLTTEQARKVVVGHRYHCIRCLAAMAWKCRFDVVIKKNQRRPIELKGVTFEELKKDAYSLLEVFESKTQSDDNHFTSADIEAALLGYGDTMFKMTKKTLALLSGLDVPIGPRHNWRSQDVHLKRARALRDLDREAPWDINRGRKGERPETSRTALEIFRWQQEYPNGSKSACAQALHLDPHTVAKWWPLGRSRTIPQQIAEWRESHPDSTNKSACARDLGLSHPTVRKWWDQGTIDSSEKI